MKAKLAVYKKAFAAFLTPATTLLAALVTDQVLTGHAAEVATKVLLAVTPLATALGVAKAPKNADPVVEDMSGRLEVLVPRIEAALLAFEGKSTPALVTNVTVGTASPSTSTSTSALPPAEPEPSPEPPAPTT